MSGAPTWDRNWLESAVTKKSMRAWRGVEAQHVVSTMRLVDNRGEQDELERLLERSKPAQPVTDTPKHYLIFTPFRYRPTHPSRFRRGGELGIWYGAEEIYAACAEVAYWRNRFVLDSATLVKTELLTEYTFFQAEVAGANVDLLSTPWVGLRSAWTHGSDYAETQALAEAAREKGIQWICYESVRAPGNRCAAVLDVNALQGANIEATMQTWHCKASKDAVMMVRGAQTFVWQF
jgi:hypothetical protein